MECRACSGSAEPIIRIAIGEDAITGAANSACFQKGTEHAVSKRNDLSCQSSTASKQRLNKAVVIVGFRLNSTQTKQLPAGAVTCLFSSWKVYTGLVSPEHSSRPEGFRFTIRRRSSARSSLICCLCRKY